MSQRQQSVRNKTLVVRMTRVRRLNSWPSKARTWLAVSIFRIGAQVLGAERFELENA